MLFVDWLVVYMPEGLGGLLLLVYFRCGLMFWFMMPFPGFVVWAVLVWLNGLLSGVVLCVCAWNILLICLFCCLLLICLLGVVFGVLCL